MSKNTLLTNILLALAVTVIGFMLLNLTFLFFAAGEVYQECEV